MKNIANQKILIKVGGAALEDELYVSGMCANIAQLRKNGNKVIVVHGGGVAINRELEARNITWSFYEGQRVTSKEMVEVVEMVLCGKNNRALVKKLGMQGVSACGFSGVDDQTILCKKMDEKLGEVGEILSINTKIINMLMDTMVPVIAPLGVDKDWNVLNINADWAASRIAEALSVDKLIYLTDTSGVLDAQGQTIPVLYADEIEQQIASKVVSGGMLAKSRTVLKALDGGVKEIFIVNGKVQDPLFKMEGTSCKKHRS